MNCDTRVTKFHTVERNALSYTLATCVQKCHTFLMSHNIVISSQQKQHLHEWTHYQAEIRPSPCRNGVLMSSAHYQAPKQYCRIPGSKDRN
jgi:hypothetical protein